MFPDGTQTCNPRKQRAADPRLRPRGHWDRHVIYKRTVLEESYCNTTIQSLVKALVILSFQIFSRISQAIMKNKSLDCHHGDIRKEYWVDLGLSGEDIRLSGLVYEKN
jgi:hypothetical protein